MGELGINAGGTNQIIALSTVHQSVHNRDNLQPQIQQLVRAAQQYYVVQKHFTQERRRPNPRLAHAQRITLIDFGLEELRDKWDQYFAENGSPFCMIGRSERVGEECTLHSAKGLLTDFAARI